MGNPTYDHFAYIKSGLTRDLDWLERLLRGLPGLTGVEIRREAFGTSEGWTVPTTWQRMQAKLRGTTRFLDDLERINTQPALVLMKDGVTLRFVYNNQGHVAQEARELADDELPAVQGATARIECDGDDPNLLLEKVYTRICNALHDEGSFVLYSGQSGVWERTS
jgi:hypothetical protein